MTEAQAGTYVDQLGVVRNIDYEVTELVYRYDGVRVKSLEFASRPCLLVDIGNAHVHLSRSILRYAGADDLLTVYNVKCNTIRVWNGDSPTSAWSVDFLYGRCVL